MKTEKQVRTWKLYYGEYNDPAWNGPLFEGNVKVIAFNDHQEIVAGLEARINRLREALKFYADANAWYRGNEDQKSAYICSRLPKDQEQNGVGTNILAGKIARQALKDDEAGK